MAEITVETLVEIRTPYLAQLAKQAENYPTGMASLIHEGMVGIVSRIDVREIPIQDRRSERTVNRNEALPKTRTETRVMVVWERSEEQGGGTWTAYYPLSALKIVK